MSPGTPTSIRSPCAVWRTGDRLNVQIDDRGRGFDPDAVLSVPQTGGLAGMQERVKLLAGQLTIESRPGAGTHITADLPCMRQPKAPSMAITIILADDHPVVRRGLRDRWRRNRICPLWARRATVWKPWGWSIDCIPTCSFST